MSIEEIFGVAVMVIMADFKSVFTDIPYEDLIKKLQQKVKVWHLNITTCGRTVGRVLLQSIR